MEVCLIFPHQLFKAHPALKTGRHTILIEEWLFFKQYNFHKQKLALHRATMQYYNALLQHNHYSIEYIEASEEHADVRKLPAWLATKKVTKIFYADVVDDWLRRRLHSACSKYKIEWEEFTTPAFLNTMQEANKYFNNRKSYFQTDFYIAERKKRNVLVENGKHPAGGKWSFDADNRKKFPKTDKAPPLSFPKQNKFVTEAIAYVNKHFSNNPGKCGEPFASSTFYPTTHQEAQQWLNDFFKQRFERFGLYEDAIVAEEKVLYHSVLSPLLNSGLLEPQDVIDQALQHASSFAIALNSVEGFLRQIMGWREYIRIVYEREGHKQRTMNYWHFTRKIPYRFWTGETGIQPIDMVIKRLLTCGYTHHIERLMVLGNFMLLCEFAPDEVYRWFMEMYIDAYDWVMVPNTYGMTQFSDGGIMTTKPYISSSNYIKKMSDFKKGSWEQIWDALFWRFMHVHRQTFERNPRLGMLLKTWDKKPAEERQSMLEKAEIFLESLSA